MDRPITDPILKRSTVSLILISNGLLALSFSEHGGTIDGLLYDSRLLVANGMTPLVAMKLQKAWMAATMWTLQHPFTRVLYSAMLAGGICCDNVLLQVPWLLSSFLEIAAQLVVVLASFWIMLFYMEPMTVPHVLSIILQLILIQIYSGVWTLIALWTFQSAIEEMIEVLAVTRGPAVILTFDPNTQRMVARELRPNQLPIWSGDQRQPPQLPGMDEDTTDDDTLSHESQGAPSHTSKEDKKRSEGITRGPEIEMSPESSQSSSLDGPPGTIGEHAGEIIGADAVESTSHAPVDASADVGGSTSVSGASKKPCAPDTTGGICPPDWYCHLFRDKRKNDPPVAAEPETNEIAEDVAEDDRQEHTAVDSIYAKSEETADATNVNGDIPDSSSNEVSSNVAETSPDSRVADEAISDLEKESKKDEKNVVLHKESCKTCPPQSYCQSSHTRKGELPVKAIVESEAPDDISVDGNKTMDPTAYEEDVKENEDATSNIQDVASNTGKENTEGGANVAPCVDSMGRLCEYYEGPGKCPQHWHCQSSHVKSESPENMTVVDMGDKTMDPIVYEEEAKENVDTTRNIADDTSNIEKGYIEGGANVAPCVDSLGNLCEYYEGTVKCQPYFHCQSSHTRKGERLAKSNIESESPEDVTMDPIVYEEDAKENVYATSNIADDTLNTVEENTGGGANAATCVDSQGDLCEFPVSQGNCPRNSHCHRMHLEVHFYRVPKVHEISVVSIHHQDRGQPDQQNHDQMHQDQVNVADAESAAPGDLITITNEKSTGGSQIKLIEREVCHSYCRKVDDKSAECVECDPPAKDQRSMEVLGEDQTYETQSTMDEETIFAATKCESQLCEADAFCRARGAEFATDHSSHNVIVDETRITEGTTVLEKCDKSKTMADTSEYVSTKVIDNREKDLEKSPHEDWWCPPDASQEIEDSVICSKLCAEMSDRKVAEDTAINKKCSCIAVPDTNISFQQAHTNYFDRDVTENTIVSEKDSVKAIVEETSTPYAVHKDWQCPRESMCRIQSVTDCPHVNLTYDSSEDEITVAEDATPDEGGGTIPCPPEAICQAYGPTVCSKNQSATTYMTDQSEAVEDRMTEDVQEAEASGTGGESTWYDAADDWECPVDAYCRTGEGFFECEAVAKDDTENIAETGYTINEPNAAATVVEDVAEKCKCVERMEDDVQEEHENEMKDDNRNETRNEDLFEENADRKKKVCTRRKGQ